MPRQKSKSTLDRRRVRDLLAFDRSFAKAQPLLSLLNDTGWSTELAIVGVDEVGRGCLAGPVVAAAVCLPAVEPGSRLEDRLKRLDDSKVLTAAERMELAEVIRSTSSFAIGEASVEEIDALNIFQATLLAMKRALSELGAAPPSVVLVDGNKGIPGIACHQVPVVKGDSLSASIAAAAILAKVHRDAFMEKLSEKFPAYLWHKNKGYGSQEHRDAIRRVGISPWHRRSFRLDR
ncbi:MAG TPA: ribonuclease HII [Candidatus Obscuribacterales bacterium]